MGREEPIVLVSPVEDASGVLLGYLAEQEYRVERIESVEDAMRRVLDGSAPCAVILDEALVGPDRRKMISRARCLGVRSAMILLLSAPLPPEEEEALRLLDACALCKPVEREALRGLLEALGRPCRARRAPAT